MYGLIRDIIFLVIAIFVCNYIRKSKIVRKKLTIVVAVILCVILCTLSALLPVENLFISFPSPQAVYDYYGYGKIEVLIEGKDSCLALKNKEIGFIPKTKYGYKIFTYFSHEKVIGKSDRRGRFTIYQAKGTSDYYIVGSLYIQPSELIISDNVGSDIQVVHYENDSQIEFFGYINGYTDSYSITLNGEEIHFHQ